MLAAVNFGIVGLVVMIIQGAATAATRFRGGSRVSALGGGGLASSAGCHMQCFSWLAPGWLGGREASASRTGPA